MLPGHDGTSIARGTGGVRANGVLELEYRHRRSGSIMQPNRSTGAPALDTKETPMRPTRLVLAAVLALVGIIWLGQGLGFIAGSFMTGSLFWAARGCGAPRAGRGHRGGGAPPERPSRWTTARPSSRPSRSASGAAFIGGLVATRLRLPDDRRLPAGGRRRRPVHAGPRGRHGDRAAARRAGRDPAHVRRRHPLLDPGPARRPAASAIPGAIGQILVATLLGAGLGVLLGWGWSAAWCWAWPCPWRARSCCCGPSRSGASWTRRRAGSRWAG